MSLVAWLEDETCCWRCGVTLRRRLSFAWGFCTAFAVSDPRSTYHIGDSIHWFENADGTTTPWCWVSQVPPTSANVGDPAVVDLDVYDSDPPFTCTACAAPVVGMGVRIRGGAVTGSFAAAPGMPSGEVEYVEVVANGIAVPRPEWTNRRLVDRPAS